MVFKLQFCTPSARSNFLAFSEMSERVSGEHVRGLQLAVHTAEFEYVNLMVLRVMQIQYKLCQLSFFAMSERVSGKLHVYGLSIVFLSEQTENRHIMLCYVWIESRFFWVNNSTSVTSKLKEDEWSQLIDFLAMKTRTVMIIILCKSPQLNLVMAMPVLS